MIRILTILLCIYTLNTFGQLTLPEAKEAAKEYNRKSYSYLEEFEGHNGYAAPIIITKDGGTIFFGYVKEDKTNTITKLTKDGSLNWSIPIKEKFDEMEIQCLVQDQKGNYFVFVLSYNHEKYRGGTERIIYINKKGKIMWDILLGDYSPVNSPTCSYIKLLDDGRLELRGQIQKESINEYGDGDSYFWKGWLNNKGELTQEIGEIIDWKDISWKKFYEIER